MIMTNKKYMQEDIADSAEDAEKLKPDLATIDLPDLPAGSGSKKTTAWTGTLETFSSADEEGDEVFESTEDTDNVDVSPLEKELLNEAFDPAYDTDLPIESLSLDDRDNEGELLEEGAQNKDLFGKDLDDNLIEEEDEETTGEGQQ
jgi:hypothetical protein